MLSASTWKTLSCLWNQWCVTQTPFRPRVGEIFPDRNSGSTRLRQDSERKKQKKKRLVDWVGLHGKSGQNAFLCENLSCLLFSGLPFPCAASSHADGGSRTRTDEVWSAEIVAEERSSLYMLSDSKALVIMTTTKHVNLQAYSTHGTARQECSVCWTDYWTDTQSQFPR